MDEFENLQLNTNLSKDSSQIIQPQGAVYASVNPQTPSNSPSNYTQPGGAPEVITATVITSCFIQTSALPYRITMQNNDITLYDDTTENNGSLVGSASRIVFTHDSATKTGIVTSGFILQKRASTLDSYDNILELYSPDNEPNFNSIFIGRTGTGEATNRNMSLIEMTVRYDSQVSPALRGYVNGIMRLRATRDSAAPTTDNTGFTLGDSGAFSPGNPANTGITVRNVGQGAQGGSTISHVANITDNPTLPSVNPTSGQATAGITVLNGNIYFYGTLNIPSAVVAPTIGLTGGITWSSGSGTPNGHITAPPGSLYSNTAGGATNTLWVKESGTGNTGWVAK